jgi:hypothetical protein
MKLMLVSLKERKTFKKKILRDKKVLLQERADDQKVARMSARKVNF